MDLDTITVAQFKSFFYRDFPYLPVYDDDALYNEGAIVYFPTTLLFYKCGVNGTTGVAPNFVPTPPAINPWAIIPGDVDNYVLDADISRAFQEAQFNLNQGLFASDAQITIGYMYLTAHYLVNDLRTAKAGIAAVAAFPVSSRTVGSVSESYDIPDAYKTSPIYSFYTQSAYGLKFLSLILPKLVGNVGVVAGWTNP